jgi:histone H3/H4
MKVSGLVVSEIRGYTQFIVEHIVKKSSYVAKYAKKKTIDQMAILIAAKSIGLACRDPNIKKLSKCNDSKMKNCLVFPRANFSQMIKDMAQSSDSNIPNDMRISDDFRTSTMAKELLQVIIEDHLRDVIVVACKTAKQQGSTIMPRHFDVCGAKLRPE